MLKLPNITLIALTNDPESHYEAFRKSQEGVEWGAVKLIVDYKCNSIDEWNRKIIFELHNYVQTDYAMLIHGDGYVVRPDLWRDEFLDYDYIGAPWPLPQDNYSYLTPKGELVRIGNSVSLRRRNTLTLPTELNLEWKSYYGNTNEDGFLCCHNRDILQQHGVKFAPLDVAKHFSREHDIPENAGIETFAFHTVDL